MNFSDFKSAKKYLLEGIRLTESGLNSHKKAAEKSIELASLGGQTRINSQVLSVSTRNQFTKDLIGPLVAVEKDLNDFITGKSLPKGLISLYYRDAERVFSRLEKRKMHPTSQAKKEWVANKFSGFSDDPPFYHSGKLKGAILDGIGDSQIGDTNSIIFVRGFFSIGYEFNYDPSFVSPMNLEAHGKRVPYLRYVGKIMASGNSVGGEPVIEDEGLSPHPFFGMTDVGRRQVFRYIRGRIIEKYRQKFTDSGKRFRFIGG